jgi:DNA-binding transcriptional regulator GbsR (MarR family)
MPVSRPAVSQHLKVLKDAGLVSEHQEGTRRIYQLNPVALAALRDQLDAYWRRALANYAELLSEGTSDTDQLDTSPSRERTIHDSDASDRTPERRRRRRS